MLIDFHTHAFPPRIAQGAMRKLSYAAGGLQPQTDGTLASLKEQMRLDGVDIAVVQSIATNPTQQSNVNSFAMEINRDDAFFAFGSVHPDAPDVLAELERITNEIEQAVMNSMEREISTNDIGEMVMERLKPLDEVSYIRFASVYRQFKDVNSFMRELTKILEEK